MRLKGRSKDGWTSSISIRVGDASPPSVPNATFPPLSRRAVWESGQLSVRVIATRRREGTRAHRCHCHSTNSEFHRHYPGVIREVIRRISGTTLTFPVRAPGKRAVAGWEAKPNADFPGLGVGKASCCGARSNPRATFPTARPGKSRVSSPLSRRRRRESEASAPCFNREGCPEDAPRTLGDSEGHRRTLTLQPEPPVDAARTFRGRQNTLMDIYNLISLNYTHRRCQFRCPCNRQETAGKWATCILDEWSGSSLLTFEGKSGSCHWQPLVRVYKTSVTFRALFAHFSGNQRTRHSSECFHRPSGPLVSEDHNLTMHDPRSGDQRRHGV